MYKVFLHILKAKCLNTKINNTHINSQEATEEIKEEIKRYLESGNKRNPDWKRSKTLMILYTQKTFKMQPKNY